MLLALSTCVVCDFTHYVIPANSLKLEHTTVTSTDIIITFIITKKVEKLNPNKSLLPPMSYNDSVTFEQYFAFYKLPRRKTIGLLFKRDPVQKEKRKKMV